MSLECGNHPPPAWLREGSAGSWKKPPSSKAASPLAWFWQVRRKSSTPRHHRQHHTTPTDTPTGKTNHSPRLPLGDGRGEVPGGDLGAKKNAVELAAARRGPGRQPRLKPAETNAKTAERMRTVRGGIVRKGVNEMSCRQDILHIRLTRGYPGGRFDQGD